MRCVLETSTFLLCDGAAMSLNLWLMYIVMGLFGMGCDTPKSEMTVLNKAQILEQIEKTPLRSKELCGQMGELSQQEFCIQYALQLIPKEEVTTIRNLCPTLEGNVKGECWFQIAESTLQVEDCEQAAPFVEECYGHITMRVLQQSNVNTWKEVEEIANNYRLNFTDPIYGTMVYQYWFRNTSLLQLDDCMAMKNPKICRDALAMLYFQRLKEWDLDPNFSCDKIPDKLAHNNQHLFQSSFEKIYKQKCD